MKPQRQQHNSNGTFEDAHGEKDNAAHDRTAP
jgi:hypothetical protein